MEESRSAGLLMFRRGASGIQFFLVHPGGPFFARKDEGVWSIPKGLIEAGEDPVAVAAREFTEETGRSPAECGLREEPISLGSIRQRGGKVVEAWAFEGDWPDGAHVTSNRFPLEWPPKSGRVQEFPEVDRGEFFDLPTARRKLNPAQVELVERLVQRLDPS